MNRTQHPSNTNVLGAPVDWSQETLPCGALAITACKIEGASAMKSWWQPTPEERAAIANGARVVLSVIGTCHPPVAIGVEQHGA